MEIQDKIYKTVAVTVIGLGVFYMFTMLLGWGTYMVPNLTWFQWANKTAATCTGFLGMIASGGMTVFLITKVWSI